jgi:hypothetical protein
MSNLDPVIITNITFGYADSEDRLWARLIMTDQSETTIWITRSLCQSLCNGLGRLIEKNTVLGSKEITSDEAIKKYVKKEFFEAKTTTWSANPEPPKSDIPTPTDLGSGRLCHTIQITPGDTWQLRFLLPQARPMVMPLQRPHVLKVLAALLLQGQRGGWNWQLNHEWMV